jgi:hypothetical protein
MWPKTTTFFQLNTCCYSPYVTSSLSRGCVCVYNYWWPSPAQSFSGPSPAGLMTIFYCLRFETLSTWRARSPYLYPPGTGWLSYTPRHWVPFPSPPTTHRATVEVLDPAYQSQSQSYFTTGGLSPISSSWRQAPWGSRPGLFIFNLRFLLL